VEDGIQNLSAFPAGMFAAVWAVKINVHVNTKDNGSNARQRPTGSPE
jgi:hypothetical protein